MCIVVSGGGIGGYIYLVFVFIKEVQCWYLDVEFLYIGIENGFEKKIVEWENILFCVIEIIGFK